MYTRVQSKLAELLFIMRVRRTKHAGDNPNFCHGRSINRWARSCKTYKFAADAT